MAEKGGVGPKRISKTEVIKKKPVKIAKDGESLEHLLHQKEEIETLLSSLEDAYSEAAILEEDYQHVKKRNEDKLAEINKKIEKLRAKGGEEAETPAPTPAFPARAYVERPVELVREVVKEVEKPPERVKVEKGAEEADKRFRKLMEDFETRIAGKIKQIMTATKAEESSKNVSEVITKLEKFEIDIERLKAVVETMKEGRKITDEKMQRSTESMGELRSIIYQREASLKDQEVKVGKLLDSVSQVDPEKVGMEMGKRDRDISNQGMRIERVERTIEALNETISRMRNVLVNIGSLESVINASKKVSENLQAMGMMKNNIEKSVDRVQSIYAELSERMEEFLLYRTKQDRMEDLVNELMRSVDDMNTKISRFITRDDLDAFRQTLHAVGGAKAAELDIVNELQIEKEEIKMLIKTLEDEYKNKRIPKEEFEKTKKANLDKMDEIERKIMEAKTAKAVPEEIPEAAEEERPKIEPIPPKSPKVRKERKDALLTDLEDTYKKGFISKEAYEKTKKMILSGKG